MTSSVAVSVLQNTLASNKPQHPWNTQGTLGCIIQLLVQHRRSSFKGKKKKFCLLPKANGSRNTLLFLKFKKKYWNAV